MTTAGLDCRSSARLRRVGRAVRGAGVAGASLAGVAADFQRDTGAPIFDG
jgi:hypothetical protein